MIAALIAASPTPTPPFPQRKIKSRQRRRRWRSRSEEGAQIKELEKPNLLGKKELNCETKRTVLPAVSSSSSWPAHVARSARNRHTHVAIRATRSPPPNQSPSHKHVFWMCLLLLHCKELCLNGFCEVKIVEN